MSAFILQIGYMCHMYLNAAKLVNVRAMKIHDKSSAI